MAENNVIMWYQGKKPYVVPRCDGKIQPTCPSSTRIAAEYNRGFFTLTNVINPNIFYDDYGVETPLKQMLAEAKVGDTLWLALVPPEHKVLDVFAYNELTDTEQSSFSTFDGIQLSLVTGQFKKADKDGNCPLVGGAATVAGALAFTALNKVFLQKDVNALNDTETYLGVGLKIDALPKDKTLAEIVGKIVVGAHAIDYDAQTFM